MTSYLKYGLEVAVLAKNVSLVLMVVFVSLLLTGCIASGFLEEGIKKSNQKRWTATDTNDHIIAIGKPAKPITGYDNALVLVGRNHDYLLTSAQGTNNFKNILESVDLRYLYIDLHNQKHVAVKQPADDYSCPSSFGCIDEVSLHFKKPLVQLSKNERKHLESLHFNCYGDADKVFLSCYYTTYRIALTMTQKNTNQSLKHQLKTPLPIVFYEFHASKGVLGRGARWALLPLAVVFDVVTFPIQVGVVDINK